MKKVHHHLSFPSTNPTEPTPIPQLLSHVPIGVGHVKLKPLGAEAQHVVEQAILEAERQREMFTKKHVPSAEELAGACTRSLGLHSQSMNPDPEIFPVNHYMRGFSSGEIRGARPGAGVVRMTAMRVQVQVQVQVKIRVLFRMEL